MVYRGFAGLDVPDAFKGPDARGGSPAPTCLPWTCLGTDVVACSCRALLILCSPCVPRRPPTLSHGTQSGRAVLTWSAARNRQPRRNRIRLHVHQRRQGHSPGVSRSDEMQRRCIEQTARRAADTAAEAAAPLALCGVAVVIRGALAGTSTSRRACLRCTAWSSDRSTAAPTSAGSRGSQAKPRCRAASLSGVAPACPRSAP